MDKTKITPFLEKSLNLIGTRFKVLKNVETQILLYDEVNGIYFDIQPTNRVSNFEMNGFLGFGIDMTYERSVGLNRHIEMIDTGKILLDEIRFTEGDYTVTFTASEVLLPFVRDEEELRELLDMGGCEVTQVGGYYLAVSPYLNHFDISPKRGNDILYTEHRAKNLEKGFECNTIRVKKEEENGFVRSTNHIDTTIATEGDCKFYRMTYMGKKGEPNYSSYFVSSVYDHLEGFGEWAPYQFSDMNDPYRILLKDTDIKKEEIISYLSVMQWNPDHIRFTVFKLKDQFVICIRNQAGLSSTRLSITHSNAIDEEEIKRIKEYLQTEITDDLFFEIVTQELDKFSSYLEKKLEKDRDVVDTLSTESLFHQGMEVTKALICQESALVIGQLLKKKNSFELERQKEKVKEYQ